MKKRVSFFIDGFNLYHSIREYAPNCRWINLRKLCEQLLKNDEEIIDIYYFTAYAYWNADKLRKHKTYVKALSTEKIKPVFGKFKKVTRFCSTCQSKYIAHEEKRSDVNITLYLFEEAMKDTFDRAIIVSGDSDLLPVIEMVRNNFGKYIGIALPMGRQSEEMKEESDFVIKIRRQHLTQSLFPKIISFNDEKIECPADNWV